MFMGPRVAVWVEPVEVVQWNAHVDRIRGYTHGLTPAAVYFGRLDYSAAI